MFFPNKLAMCIRIDQRASVEVAENSESGAPGEIRTAVSGSANFGWQPVVTITSSSVSSTSSRRFFCGNEGSTAGLDRLYICGIFPKNFTGTGATGMHWTVHGSNAIIVLRCSKLSGRFQDFWERRSEQRAA
jgi:hypothetical protein